MPFFGVAGHLAQNSNIMDTAGLEEVLLKLLEMSWLIRAIFFLETIAKYLNTYLKQAKGIRADLWIMIWSLMNFFLLFWWHFSFNDR